MKRSPIFRAMAAADGALPAIRPLMVLRPQAEAAGEYELLIYGDIGESWWGESVTALSIVQQLQALPAGTTQINVRINSYGGSVSDGIAIYNALKRNAARKVVTVDGVAMSSASLIAMVGDEVNMPATSLLMIHAPWGLAQGNAQDMRVMADVLDTYADAMANAYAAKSGKPKADMLALLDDGLDHYYTGEQAVAAGFADALVDALEDADSGAEEADARAAGVHRFTARAPQHIAQMAIAAAARHPAALPMAAKPRVALPNGLSLASLQETLASASGQRALVAALTTAVSANDGDLTMKLRKLYAAVHDSAADPADGGHGGSGAPAATPTAADVHAALRARNTEIKAVLEPYMQRKGVNALYMEALADPTATVDGVRAKALEIIGRELTPSGSGTVEAGADESDKFRKAISSALLIRCGLADNDGGNPYRGYAMREIARACVERSGRSTQGMDIREVVATGFTSTSDFPLLLSNTARVALLKGFEEAPETYPLFTRAGTLSDFKEVSRAGLGVFSDLDEVVEGGEYKYGTFGEYGQKVKLATYGKLFAITRQAVINDDLGAFTDVPRKMGRAAKRTIGTLVFDILTSNPTMADGVALFHATHKNLLTGAAISTSSVDAMDSAMGVQTGPDGQPLNIPLAFLIVPRALRGTAQVVQKSEFEVGASSKNNTTPNTVRDTFQVIADARLDKVSSTVWYGSADPQMVDTIEVSYLDGQQEPYMEQKQGWDVDGTEFKVRIDAGVKALDFRGLAKNPGA